MEGDCGDFQVLICCVQRPRSMRPRENTFVKGFALREELGILSGDGCL